MPCYHPLKAFIVGKTENDKNDLKIVPYDVQYITKHEGKYYYANVSACANALNCGEKLCTYSEDCFKLRDLGGFAGEVFYKFFTIPCGQCIGCRIEYSKQWATRMLLEHEYSSESHFVTLTYDNEHVPRSEYLDEETGEVKESLTLRKRDLVLFNKRLRRKFAEGVRFYACGEYGSATLRPHYHSIYFNLPISDLKFWSRSPDGKFVYYTSETLSDIWGKGHVLIADVSFETCAYVARYVTKKFKGEKSQYDFFNIEPVFSLMSRRPGIGRKWFDDNWKNVYDTYIITVSSSKGGLRFKPPRYYDTIFDGLDGARMAEIKENQVKKAQNMIRLKLEKTEKSLLEYLATEEMNFKASSSGKNLLHREEL